VDTVYFTTAWQLVHAVLEHGDFLRDIFHKLGSNAFKMWWDL